MKALSWSWWVGDSPSRRAAAEAEYERRVALETRQQESVQAAHAAWAARRRAFAEMVATWKCSTCFGRIYSYTSENDYLCEKCGFTNPVRPDGGVIRGDGVCGVPQLRRPLLPELNA